MRFQILILTFAVSCFLSVPAHPIWTQDGGTLNNSTGDHSASPSIAINNNQVYVAFHEEFDVLVKKYNGTFWESVGTTLNVNSDDVAANARIAFSQNIPYVTWYEGPGFGPYKIYVKYFNGSTWNLVGSGSLNVNLSRSAGGPSIAFAETTPYVSWDETNASGKNQVYVKHYTGGGWVQDGGSLNCNSNQNGYQTKIAISPSNVPYVTWYETTVSASEIHVKKFNGSTWEWVGTTLNVNATQSAILPSITFFGDTPYVTWQEISGSINQVYVKYFNGSGWHSLGGSLNMTSGNHANAPLMCFAGITPYVIWHENESGIQKIYVKHYSAESGWVLDPEESYNWLNVGAGFSGMYGWLGYDNNKIYAAWAENDAAGAIQIFEKHLGVVLSTPTVTASASPTTTWAATTTTTPVLILSSTPTATPSPTPTATPVHSSTPTPTFTPTSAAMVVPTFTATATFTHTALPDFEGRLLDARTCYCWPNPVTSSATRFKYGLRESAKVKISVFTLSNQAVWSREAQSLPGIHVVEWDVSGMSNGVYFYRIEARTSGGSEEAFLKKIAILR